jgi:hypothetical protein
MGELMRMNQMVGEEELTLFIGNEAREYAGLEPHTDASGRGWDSCRRLARALLSEFAMEHKRGLPTIEEPRG